MDKTYCVFCSKSIPGMAGGPLLPALFYCSDLCKRAAEAADKDDGSCQHCQKKLPSRKDGPGRYRLYCDRKCYDRHRRGSERGLSTSEQSKPTRPEERGLTLRPPNLGLLRASLEELLRQIKDHVHTAPTEPLRREWAVELRRLASALE